MIGVKPGRGPSLMGGVGAISAALFGTIWTVVAVSKGAGIILALFGVLFVAMAVVIAAYNFWAGTTKDRPSQFDLTTGDEEPDPIAKALGHGAEHTSSTSPTAEPPQAGDAAAGPRRFEGDFCPFCGAHVEKDFDFCPKCGKDI
jgi:hypothetical protein